MKPRILITCGDINGIGPELILKIFSDKNFVNQFDIKVIGPQKAFDFYSKLLKISKISAKHFLNIDIPNNFKLEPGKTDATAGRISGDAIKLGVNLCIKKYFDALVTMPINKESLNKGGYNYKGHTEMLSHLTFSKNTFMLMYSNALKAVPFTVHIPVKNVSPFIKKTKLTEKIININNVFVKTLKIRKPRIAVLALNPHSGDGGLIGNEEKKTISPVIADLFTLGLNVSGPFSADGFFGSTQYKKFDVTLSMYHDQAMIPFKILSKKSGVNFTGGLKIIRTSPAHGTAYDIAGKGKADIKSSIEAIKLAGKLSLK